MNEAKPLLSIGMIFRDDIRCLERCLQSLQPLRDAVPCELVMADTGSVDGSREIAERYADLLIDFPWTDDFSAARNATLERCSGTWYLVMDCDTWFEDVGPLVNFLREPEENKKDLVLVTAINYVSLTDKTLYAVTYSAVLARLRGGMLRYQGKVHETLHYNGQSLDTEYRPDIVLHHDGYAYASEESKKAKCERNMVLLREEIRNHPYSLRTLIQCIQSTYDLSERMKYAKRTMRALGDRRTRSSSDRASAYQNAVWGAFTAGEYDSVLTWLDEGLAELPRSILLRVDGCYHAQMVKFIRKDYAGAVRYGKIRREALEEYRGLTSKPAELLFGWLVSATEACVSQGALLLAVSAIQTEEWELVQELLGEQAEQRPPERDDLLHTMTKVVLSHAGQVDGTAYLRAQWDRALSGMETGDKAEAEFAARCAGVMLSAADEVLQTDQRAGALETLASLGDRDPARSARILLSEDPEVMRRELAGTKKWEHLSALALLHIMERGVTLTENFFRAPSELMSNYVEKMSRQAEHFSSLVLKYLETEDTENSLPRRLWALVLTSAALQKGDWEEKKGEDTALCSLFASLEAGYLGNLYRLDVLKESDLPALPPLHRFGWRLLQGVEALKRGDGLEYVRLIREGVKDAPDMANAASVLCKHLELFAPAPAPNPELLALAEQVKAILARFDPDDPAVAELKASPVYQRVANLLEEETRP